LLQEVAVAVEDGQQTQGKMAGLEVEQAQVLQHQVVQE
jgi:hypothetical protein